MNSNPFTGPPLPSVKPNVCSPNRSPKAKSCCLHEPTKLFTVCAYAKASELLNGISLSFIFNIAMRINVWMMLHVEPLRFESIALPLLRPLGKVKSLEQNIFGIQLQQPIKQFLTIHQRLFSMFLKTNSPADCPIAAEDTLHSVPCGPCQRPLKTFWLLEKSGCATHCCSGKMSYSKRLKITNLMNLTNLVFSMCPARMSRSRAAERMKWRECCLTRLKENCCPLKEE